MALACAILFETGVPAKAEETPLKAIPVTADENEEKYEIHLQTVKDRLQELDLNLRTVCTVPASLDDYGSGDIFTFETLGGYTLPENRERDLREMLLSVYEPGYDMSFMLLDIRSGKGISFNSDTPYYSASSSKAGFVVSLCAVHPEVIDTSRSYLTQITVHSSNDYYYVLEYNYGQGIYEEYADTVGVDLKLDEGGYAEYSAEDLTRLWLANYDYFSTGANGDLVGCWFETPEYSAICSVVGSDYVSRTKSGWISGYIYNVSIDAGIVYAEDNPYVLVVMSSFPSAVEELQETVQLLNDIHEEMVR